LNASRHWLRAEIEKRPVRLTGSFCAGVTFAAQEAWWTATTAARPKASVLSALSSRMPAAVAAAVIRTVDVEPARQLAHLARDQRRMLTTALVEWPLAVTGCRGWNYAEATAGGVSLDEIDPATMTSRRCDGLYLVGEMVDVDGRIGGFNFQWAWSSGYVAGHALAAAPGP
jgi:predicted Rossmann fold flavoprotein